MTTPRELQVENHGEVVVARLAGEVDLANAEPLRAAITDAVPNVALGVVLDLTPTEYLDSSGVQLVFELAERLASRGQHLCIAVPEGAAIRRVLSVVEVESTVPVRPTVDGAIDCVRESA